jgi:cytochrome P450
LFADQLTLMPPVGVAHRAVKEDVYNGMRIPNGSIVIGNAW